MIDVDDFKQVNDTFGHISGVPGPAGGYRGKFPVFSEKATLWGRIGGDEFVVLMKNIQDTEVVTERRRNIIRIFESPPASESRKNTAFPAVSALPCSRKTEQPIKNCWVRLIRRCTLQK